MKKGIVSILNNRLDKEFGIKVVPISTVFELTKSDNFSAVIRGKRLKIKHKSN